MKAWSTEAWHCEAKRGHWWRCILSSSWRPRINGVMQRRERLLMKVQPSCWQLQHSGDASSMGWPPGTVASISEANLSLEDKLHELQRVEPEKWSQILDTELLTLLFCYALIVNVLWFFPLEIRKYLTFYWFHRSPCFKNFELLRRFCILKEILSCLKRLIIKCLTL